MPCVVLLSVLRSTLPNPTQQSNREWCSCTQQHPPTQELLLRSLCTTVDAGLWILVLLAAESARGNRMTKQEEDQGEMVMAKVPCACNNKVLRVRLKHDSDALVVLLPRCGCPMLPAVGLVSRKVYWRQSIAFLEYRSLLMPSALDQRRELNRVNQTDVPYVEDEDTNSASDLDFLRVHTSLTGGRYCSCDKACFV